MLLVAADNSIAVIPAINDTSKVPFRLNVSKFVNLAASAAVSTTVVFIPITSLSVPAPASIFAFASVVAFAVTTSEPAPPLKLVTPVPKVVVNPPLAIPLASTVLAALFKVPILTDCASPATVIVAIELSVSVYVAVKFVLALIFKEVAEAPSIVIAPVVFAAPVELIVAVVTPAPSNAIVPPFVPLEMLSTASVASAT